MTEAEFDFALTQVLQNFGWTKVGSETVKTGVHKLRATITEQAARIAQLERYMSELAPERISIQKQAWLEADRQYQIDAQAARINELEDALRVSRKRLVLLGYHHIKDVRDKINELIGE